MQKVHLLPFKLALRFVTKYYCMVDTHEAETVTLSMEELLIDYADFLIEEIYLHHNHFLHKLPIV